MKKRNLLLCAGLCMALLAGCASSPEKEAENAIEKAASENEIENYFETEAGEIPIEIFSSEDNTKSILAQVAFPQSFQLTEVRGITAEGNLSLLDDGETPTVEEALSGDLFTGQAAIYSVTAEGPDEETYFYVQTTSGTYNGGVHLSIEDLSDMYPAGESFTYEDHACYLLGSGTGYTGVRLGDLTVYYEVEPDTGKYLQLGYEGPLTGQVDDMDLARALCSLVTVERK